MAINTTGNNGSVVGVTGVHPDNIGKGIKWNDTTKKYEVDVKEDSGIIINELGELEVRVSELEDNALRVIDGKLYYGTRARPELANLYVDAVNGVDQDPLKVAGAGTRAMPLKTLGYALSLAESNTTRYVWLHENQDHRMSALQEITLKTGSVYIESYGPRFDALLASGKYDRRAAYETVYREGLQPRIVFEGVKTLPYLDYSIANFLCIAVQNNTNLTISFCSIHNEYPALLDTVATAPTKYLHVSRGSRIQTAVGGIVELEGNHFTSSGFPTVSPTVSNQSEVLANIPSLGLVYPLNGNLEIRRVFGLQETYKGMLVGFGFWEFALSGSSSVSLNNVGYLLPQVTKKVNITTVNEQNGVKQVLAPKVDVDPNLFS